MPHSNRHNLVVGLGKSGLSCVRHLRALGERVTVCDTRADPPGLGLLRVEYPQVEVHLGDLGAAPFARVDRVVISPGLDRRLLPLAAGVPVVGDIELFAERATAPVVAITGTNGKSTVTTMVGAMAAACGRRVLVGGNLGLPALELLDAPPPDLYVLELSSYQLEVTESLASQVAALLNLSPHHLDRYPDYAAYVAAKQRILRGDGIAVLNRDDAAVSAAPCPGRRRLTFGLGPPEGDAFGLLTGAGEAWLARGTRRLLRSAALRVPGRHNHANALAALAIAAGLELPEAECLAALQAYPGLPHRLEWVAEQHGVRWYNDSKATNVGATLAALHGLDGPLLLIAGGAAHGVDFAPLAEAARGRVRAAVLVGEQAVGLEGALRGATEVHCVPDMTAAVGVARQLARPGDSVLLSPACQSFDRYRDFEHRGRVFSSEVRRQLAAAGAAGVAP